MHESNFVNYKDEGKKLLSRRKKSLISMIFGYCRNVEIL